jgi:hypothetical protein
MKAKPNDVQIEMKEKGNEEDDVPDENQKIIMAKNVSTNSKVVNPDVEQQKQYNNDPNKINKKVLSTGLDDVKIYVQ